MDGLRIEVARPADRLDRRTGIVVVVGCAHGRTRLPIKRTCRNGCHRGSDRRFLACRTLHPTRLALRRMGVMLHGRRLGCGCDETYWLVEGPTMEEVGMVRAGVDEGLVAPSGLLRTRTEFEWRAPC